MKTLKKQAGFTLIELVIVIVILGILAATAAPKFINLQSDAKEGTLNAIKASVETAMAVVHSKALIKGTEAAATGTVVIDSAGTTVNTVYGYPDATTTDMGKLLDINASDFTIGTATGGTILIYPASLTPTPTATGAACTVEYTKATSSAKATVVVNTGC